MPKRKIGRLDLDDPLGSVRYLLQDFSYDDDPSAFLFDDGRMMTREVRTEIEQTIIAFDRWFEEQELTCAQREALALYITYLQGKLRRYERDTHRLNFIHHVFAVVEEAQGMLKGESAHKLLGMRLLLKIMLDDSGVQTGNEQTPMPHYLVIACRAALEHTEKFMEESGIK